jgi:hypothetical protein
LDIDDRPSQLDEDDTAIDRELCRRHAQRCLRWRGIRDGDSAAVEVLGPAATETPFL